MNVLVYDDRLEGSAPKGNHAVLEVGDHYKLPELISRLKVIADNLGKIEILQILAHGIEEDGIGGFGILLCKEELTNNTVHMLRPLEGKIGKIVLSACAAANTAVGSKRLDADGDLLCKRIAGTTGAWVKASTYRQEYSIWSSEKSWGSDFGNWEGDAWWFSPKGMKYKADMGLL
jgi:hypothetical protein